MEHGWSGHWTCLGWGGWGWQTWGLSRRKALQGESYSELANKLASDREEGGGGGGDGVGRGGDSFSQA